jgi:hypothetical protein
MPLPLISTMPLSTREMPESILRMSLAHFSDAWIFPASAHKINNSKIDAITYVIQPQKEKCQFMMHERRLVTLSAKLHGCDIWR